MESLIFVGYFEYIFDAIKRYNMYYRVLIIEENFKGNQNILTEYFDKVIRVYSIDDKYTMDRVIEGILKERSIRAIYATHEGAVQICGFLREKYNIEGINEHQANSVRDKLLMKEIISRDGIRTANVQKITSKSDLLDFISANQYPIVIKPRNGSATQNTYIIRNRSELDRLVYDINIYDNNFIIENFIKGDEYHCDSIVVDGRVIFSTVGKYLANMIDTICSDKPAASIIYPSYCNEENVIKKIKLLNKQVINALKIKNSICHLEVFETANGEVIFGEIATRIGGGPLMGKTIGHGYHVDIYEAFVDVEIHNYQLPIQNTANMFLGFVALPSRKGRIVEIASEEDYINISGIKEIVISNKIGDFIDDKTNTTRRTGYIIVEDSNYENLKNKLIEIYDNFNLVVEQPKFSIGSIYG